MFYNIIAHSDMNVAIATLVNINHNIVPKVAVKNQKVKIQSRRVRRRPDMGTIGLVKSKGIVLSLALSLSKVN